jgi:putative redox protein
MDIVVTLPGNKKVDAEYKGFTIHTDQPVYAGGDGTAPAPFDLFLVSIATCGGIYIVNFLQRHRMPLDGVRLLMRKTKDEETRMITKITIDIELPPDFPERYKRSLIKSVDLCSVKQHMLEAPEFEIRTVTAE